MRERYCRMEDQKLGLGRHEIKIASAKQEA